MSDQPIFDAGKPGMVQFVPSKNSTISLVSVANVSLAMVDPDGKVTFNWDEIEKQAGSSDRTVSAIARALLAARAVGRRDESDRLAPH